MELDSCYERAWAKKSLVVTVKIVIPVWGSNYLKTFFNLALPTHMNPTNIPSISETNAIEYVFYTSKKDEESIQNLISQSGVTQYAKIRIETLNKRQISHNYIAYGIAHNRELRKSVINNDYVFLLNADIIISSNFFAEAIKIAQQGYKVVNIICPRAVLEDVEKTLLDEKATFIRDISKTPSEIAEIWKRNIHPMMTYHLFPKTAGDDLLPASLIWHGKNDSYFFRNFHLHPILIVPNKKKIKRSKKTIDAGGVFDYFELNEIYTETSNKDFFSIELSTRSSFYLCPSQYGDSKSLSLYFSKQNKSNFNNFTHEVLVGDFSEVELHQLKNISNSLIMELAIDYLHSQNLKGKLPDFVFEFYIATAAYLVSKKNLLPNPVYSFLKAIHRKIMIFNFPHLLK